MSEFNTHWGAHIPITISYSAFLPTQHHHHHHHCGNGGFDFQNVNTLARSEDGLNFCSPGLSLAHCLSFSISLCGWLILASCPNTIRDANKKTLDQMHEEYWFTPADAIFSRPPSLFCLSLSFVPLLHLACITFHFFIAVWSFHRFSKYKSIPWMWEKGRLWHRLHIRFELCQTSKINFEAQGETDCQIINKHIQHLSFSLHAKMGWDHLSPPLFPLKP